MKKVKGKIRMTKILTTVRFIFSEPIYFSIILYYDFSALFWLSTNLQGCTYNTWFSIRNLPIMHNTENSKLPSFIRFNV